MGKSRLADALATRSGFRHVELDRYLSVVYATRRPDARGLVRNSFYRSLLSRAGLGHVIEGDDLVIEDRWFRSDRFGREPRSVRFLAELARTYGVRPVVLGSSASSFRARVASLERDEGWVSKVSREERSAYAAFQERGIQELRDGAQALGVEYFETDVEDFTASINRIADRIAATP